MFEKISKPAEIIKDNGSEDKKFLCKVFVGVGIFVAFILSVATAKLSSSELALFLGFFIGTFAKVIIPFIRKIQQGKISKFDVKYFWTILTTFFYGIPLNWALIYLVPVNEAPWALMLIIGYFIGVGTDWKTEEMKRYIDMIIEVYKELQKMKEMPDFPSIYEAEEEPVSETDNTASETVD